MLTSVYRRSTLAASTLNHIRFRNIEIFKRFFFLHRFIFGFGKLDNLIEYSEILDIFDMESSK
jgi:hypothetical protein